MYINNIVFSHDFQFSPSESALRVTLQPVRSFLIACLRFWEIAPAQEGHTIISSSITLQRQYIAINCIILRGILSVRAAGTHRGATQLNRLCFSTSEIDFIHAWDCFQQLPDPLGGLFEYIRWKLPRRYHPNTVEKKLFRFFSLSVNISISRPHGHYQLTDTALNCQQSPLLLALAFVGSIGYTLETIISVNTKYWAFYRYLLLLVRVPVVFLTLSAAACHR